jgi:hypothetical protein
VAVEVWQHDRPKQRPPLYAFRVTIEDRIVFESAWVSVHFRSADDAQWFANVIEALAERGSFAGCPGHPGQVTTSFAWTRDLDDDCVASIHGFDCHAEHMEGPAHGGPWYCAVQSSAGRYFHTIDRAAEPRSGLAARWLCEIVASAAAAGLIEPY